MTAEEILDTNLGKRVSEYLWGNLSDAKGYVLEAMQEYSQSQNAELTEELGLLKIHSANKETLLKSCEQALEQRDRENEELIRENEELKKEVADLKRDYYWLKQQFGSHENH